MQSLTGFNAEQTQQAFRPAAFVDYRTAKDFNPTESEGVTSLQKSKYLTR